MIFTIQFLNHHRQNLIYLNLYLIILKINGSKKFIFKDGRFITVSITNTFLLFLFQGYHNRLNSRISKYRPNTRAFIRCIQGEENRFNHLLIQMKGGLAARPKTKKTSYSTKN
jgi:hypothetical protein